MQRKRLFVRVTSRYAVALVLCGCASSAKEPAEPRAAADTTRGTVVEGGKRSGSRDSVSPEPRDERTSVGGNVAAHAESGEEDDGAVSLCCAADENGWRVRCDVERGSAAPQHFDGCTRPSRALCVHGVLCERRGDEQRCRCLEPKKDG